MPKDQTPAESEAIERLPAEDEFLATPQAAGLLCCSESYLEKKRVTGDGPPFMKLSGGKVIYSKNELIGWAKSRRRRATNEN